MIYLNRTGDALRTNIKTTAKRLLTTAENAMKSGMLLMQEASNEIFVCQPIARGGTLISSVMLLMQEASNEIFVCQPIARGGTLISSVVTLHENLLLEKDQCVSWFLLTDDRSGHDGT